MCRTAGSRLEPTSRVEQKLGAGRYQLLFGQPRENQIVVLYVREADLPRLEYTFPLDA